MRGWTSKQYHDRRRELINGGMSRAQAERRTDREARDANNRAAEAYRKQQEGER